MAGRQSDRYLRLPSDSAMRWGRVAGLEYANRAQPKLTMFN
jgi:hypothetical protein